MRVPVTIVTIALHMLNFVLTLRNKDKGEYK